MPKVKCWGVFYKDEMTPDGNFENEHEVRPLDGKLRAVNLFVNYYRPADPARAAEIEECFARNLRNENITRIFAFSDDAIAPRTDAKTVSVGFRRRPTYADMFEYADIWVNPDDINIIANADIFFDNSLLQVRGRDLTGQVLALTRCELTLDGPQLHKGWGSQDAWIWSGPLQAKDCAFPLGAPGCDNRIARVLHDQGLAVYNPCLSVRCYHLHKERERNYTLPLVPGPYLALRPEAFPGDLQPADARVNPDGSIVYG